MLTNRRDGEHMSLSPREREVLGLLAQGARGTELADELGLSLETIRTHVRNAMVKLQARTRAQAVAIAVEQGVVSATPQEEQPPKRPATSS